VERGLIFSFWIQAAKDPVALRLALEALAGSQFESFKNNGRYMVSASVAGKSFSFQFQKDMDPATLARLAYEAWRKVKDFTTTAQINAFLSLNTGQVSYPNYGVQIAVYP
jgi:hypothetical protein